ncbi:MAG TPA: outer membrane beta-barrel protein [Pseudomonadales bacterium]
MILSQMKRAGVMASTVLGGVMLANAAMASEHGLDYTFMEAGYQHVEIDDFDADGEALALQGSVALNHMFNLVGNFQDGSIDAGAADVDVTTIELGGGMHLPLSPTVDFVTELTWINMELDAGGFGDVDDDGYGLGAGVRAMVTPSLELGGGIKYSEVADEDETSFGGKIVYHFTDMFAMSGMASFGDNTTTYGLGLRANFHGL